MKFKEVNKILQGNKQNKTKQNKLLEYRQQSGGDQRERQRRKMKRVKIGQIPADGRKLDFGSKYTESIDVILKYTAEIYIMLSTITPINLTPK